MSRTTNSNYNLQSKRVYSSIQEGSAEQISDDEDNLESEADPVKTEVAVEDAPAKVETEPVKAEDKQETAPFEPVVKKESSSAKGTECDQ